MTRRRSAGPLQRALHPLIKRLETTVHPLRYLFVEVTQRCNLACRHCGSDCGREPNERELTTEQWLGFFDTLGAHVDRRSVVLVLTGGEPFCHPRLDDLLDGIARNGLAWGMVTNGYALSPKGLARLLERGISSITVSLDGLRESHDWLRRREGSFDRAVAGIGNLARAPIPYFDVVTCVHPRNLAELPGVADLLTGLGVPAWRLFSIFPKGRAAQNRELMLPPEGFRQMMAFIAEERSRRGDEGISIQYSCEGYMPTALDRQVRDQPYFCRAGINIGSVLCDGSIAACPNISRSLVQGNILTDDLAAVWEERFAPYRDRSWMRTGPCVGCAEWKRCLGNSLHLWDDEAGQTALCTFRTVSPKGGE